VVTQRGAREKKFLGQFAIGPVALSLVVFLHAFRHATVLTSVARRCVVCKIANASGGIATAKRIVRNVAWGGKPRHRIAGKVFSPPAEATRGTPAESGRNLLALQSATMALRRSRGYLRRILKIRRRRIMIKKQMLLPDRVRRPPAEGWSWIDRGFLRNHASRLSHDAILLYFFLAAVSDKHGLSFYRDGTIAVRLRMSEQAVVQAREELVTEDLVAYRAPLTQVLSLRPPALVRRGGGLQQLGDIFRTLDNDAPDHRSRRSS
jgi:hypothetical protein